MISAIDDRTATWDVPVGVANSVVVHAGSSGVGQAAETAGGGGGGQAHEGVIRREGNLWVCGRCVEPGHGRFKRKSDVVRHLDTTHESSGDHPCERDECDKVFNRRDVMLRHLKTCGLGLKRGPKPRNQG